MKHKDTQKKRFKKLIKYLDYIQDSEPERFNIKSWVNIPYYGVKDDILNKWRHAYENRTPLNCNTTACVVGHLPVRFKEFEWGGDHSYHVRFVDDKRLVESLQLSEFFGGDDFDWGHIIYELNYPDNSLSEVLVRLRMLYNKLHQKEHETYG